MTEVAYQSAMVTLLDRDTQAVENLTLYPITRVELREFHPGVAPITRTFTVREDGKWTEVQ